MELGNATNFEVDDDGFPGIQVDLFGGQEAGAPPFEMHAPLGLFCSPIDPEKDADGNPTANACTVGHWYEGSRGHAVAYNDPRVIGLVTKLGLPKGSTVLYPIRPSGLSYVAIRTDDGSINIVHANGAKVVIDDSGVKVTGPVISLGTAPSGVATATSMAALLAGIQALCAALTPFANSPLNGLALGTGAAVGTAATALATLTTLATNFSQTVKAGA